MKRKRILFFLLAACLCMTLLPTAAAAETLEGKCGENAEFSFHAETGTLVISGTGAVTLQDTAIYDQRASIKSIEIINGVTSIGENGFSGCSALTEISIPDSVTEIGEGAFFRCSQITEIKLPPKLTRIERYTFHGCNKLVSLWIPGGVTFLGDMAFEGCNSLRNVYFDGSVNQWTQILSEDFSWALVNATVFFNETENPFTDISKDDGCYDAVLWAFKQGITSGTGDTTFGPEIICNRAQIVTFLWRAAGCPEPEAAENPFTDVIPGSFYEKAVLWALEQNITAGTGGSCFSPLMPCSEANILTFLWRFAGTPDKTEGGDWYSDALRWAAETGLSDSIDAAASLSSGCTRGKAMEFLYRMLAA